MKPNISQSDQVVYVNIAISGHVSYDIAGVDEKYTVTGIIFIGIFGVTQADEALAGIEYRNRPFIAAGIGYSVDGNPIGAVVGRILEQNILESSQRFQFS